MLVTSAPNSQQANVVVVVGRHPAGKLATPN